MIINQRKTSTVKHANKFSLLQCLGELVIRSIHQDITRTIESLIDDYKKKRFIFIVVIFVHRRILIKLHSTFPFVYVSPRFEHCRSIFLLWHLSFSAVEIVILFFSLFYESISCSTLKIREGREEQARAREHRVLHEE
jgi:hypothetical protein